MSDLSAALLESFNSILFVVSTICIVILLMYNCGRKFAGRHKTTKNLLHNNSETSNPRKTASLNGGAEGPVQDGDTKRRRKHSKKSKNFKPEEEDKEGQPSHELAKNRSNQTEISSIDKKTKDLGKEKPRNVEDEVKADDLIRRLRNAVERSGTKRREKHRGDVSDSVGSREKPKLDSTMKIAPQHPRCSQSRRRTISDDHVGTKREDTTSDDVDHSCEKDSVSALRGNKASDGKSKQEAMALRHPSKNVRCPRSQQTSSEPHSLEYQVKTTDESRNTSSVVNKKVRGSAVVSESAGQKTARTDTDKNGSIETEERRCLRKKKKRKACNTSTSATQEERAEESDCLNSTTQQRNASRRIENSSVAGPQESLKSCLWKKENGVVANTVTEISPSEDCHRLHSSFSNQLRPCSLKIEVGALQTQRMESEQQYAVPNQEDSRSPPHPPVRTWSTDSGYAEEIGSPTWESSDDGVVTLASTEGMYHSEITRTFDNKALSANDNAKETERNKRNAWASESIPKKLQYQSPSNDVIVTDKSGHQLIDPEVRERIAKPNRPVRMPDKPFEHLSYMEMDRKRRSSGQNTNISFVDGNYGIFGRCWAKNAPPKFEGDVSSEGEDDDDSFWDLRDNVCPTFMIWGVCRLGDRCSRRHPSGRYPSTSAKTSVRLPREETRRDPASFAAVLDRKKGEPLEMFCNDVSAPQNDNTGREKLPSYSLALSSGKIKKHDSNVTIGSGKKQTYEEAWPALGSSSPRNGTIKQRGSWDLNHADQKELKKENFKRSWANSSLPVYDKSTVDESLEEGSGQWQGSEYQEEDWYGIDGRCETDENQGSIVSGKDSYSDARYKTKVGLLERQPAVDNSTESCATNEKPTPAPVLSDMCDICTDRPKDATLVCGHRFCYTCALQMRLDERVCAICRRCIVSVIKTYN